MRSTTAHKTNNYLAATKYRQLSHFSHLSLWFEPPFRGPCSYMHLFFNRDWTQTCYSIWNLNILWKCQLESGKMDGHHFSVGSEIGKTLIAFLRPTSCLGPKLFAPPPPPLLLHQKTSVSSVAWRGGINCALITTSLRDRLSRNRNVSARASKKKSCPAEGPIIHQHILFGWSFFQFQLIPIVNNLETNKPNKSKKKENKQKSPTWINMSRWLLRSLWQTVFQVAKICKQPLRLGVNTARALFYFTVQLIWENIATN